LIIVDTSVLVDFLRGGRTPAAKELRRLETDDIPFAIPAFCCQELLQGARDEREWNLLLVHLQCQRILVPEDPWSTHVEAARMYFDCRRQGITVRSSVDCFIAQQVIETEGILLHSDEDYDRIKEVRPLRTVALH
jgi:predicted nucleic acid-binding protein